MGMPLHMSQPVSHSTDLTGRLAIVTGAARGIGRASAVALARAGADVIGIDIAGPVSPIMEVVPATSDDLDETGKQVQALGRTWERHTFDQRDLDAVRRVAAQIEQAHGVVDILHANAGIQAFKPILEMTDPDWHDQIDVNLTGTANVLRAFAPIVVKSPAGRIVITSSTQGQHGTKNGSSYSASKWGLLGLMKSAALELGEHGVTVNAVIPGLVDTLLSRHEARYAQAIEESGGQPTGDEQQDEATALKGLAGKTPLGVPWVTADDVAPLVAFLASDAARMVTGTSFAATGGDSAHGMA